MSYWSGGRQSNCCIVGRERITSEIALSCLLEVVANRLRLLVECPLSEHVWLRILHLRLLLLLLGKLLRLLILLLEIGCWIEAVELLCTTS